MDTLDRPHQSREDLVQDNRSVALAPWRHTRQQSSLRNTGLSTTSHSTQALRVDNMNRRRFLKYAGATAAVVGASTLGLDYLSKQSPSSVTPTTSTTTTRQLTTTSSVSNTSTQTTQLASLQGRLFFDYNGNGIQDGEEPPVAGALVQLKDSTGTVIAETLTDSSGDYKLDT